MENQKNQLNLDDAISAMKATEPTAEQVKNSTTRIFDAIRTEPASIIPDRIRSEADYNSLLQPYLRNELNEAQKLLVEDRLASNPAYRRQMEKLRGNVRVMPAARRGTSRTRTVLPWAIAAGLLMTTGYAMMDTLDRLMAPAGPRAEIATVDGEIFKVSAAGLEPIKPGARLAEGEAVRTAKGSSAVVRLPDGSLIEMNERAELSISAAYSGSTIRLDRGNILVQAAKQKRGKLRVATRESTVSVKGTIFSVAAGLRGTQVAVIEGHVVVEQAGIREDLLPGQTTASTQVLKRTTVPEQVAWSKDSARYMAMLGELAKIRREIESLPMPAMRNESKLLAMLPADTVIYVAIPNISGTIADAARIFEERLKQSPELQKWWNTEQVRQVREITEKLRNVGSQLGDEIVIAASRNAKGEPGEPLLLAQVKGASARASIDNEIKAFAAGHYEISDSLLKVGDRSLSGGFESTSLAATVKKSYAKGAGWILAADLEQILSDSVKNDKNAMQVIGANQLQHVMVERRDVSGSTTTNATVTFSAPRTGIASWLAEPAPMPSLDLISPDAQFAFSAVTKDAGLMAKEFFGAAGNAGKMLESAETKLGISVINDLIGPLGGEVTMAIDGALLPVPTYIMAAEVYDASRLTSSLKRIVDTFNSVTAGSQMGNVTFSEQVANGRTWYVVKYSNSPLQLHFTYSEGYLIVAQTRETILKALQTRNSMASLPRSQKFKNLLPADAQVNASAVFYISLGVKLEQLPVSGEPVLIMAYAGPDSITFSSSSGFFGFGIDSLLAAGKGAPIVPQLMMKAATAGAK
jgi:hypothetical protein